MLSMRDDLQGALLARSFKTKSKWLARRLLGNIEA
jgi:hypothetical protein